MSLRTFFACEGPAGRGGAGPKGPPAPRNFQPGQSIDYHSMSYGMWVRGKILSVNDAELEFEFFKPGFWRNSGVETRTGPNDPNVHSDVLMELEVNMKGGFSRDYFHLVVDLKKVSRDNLKGFSVF